MNYRRQAWLISGFLFFCLLLWAISAYHDAFVADYRANKQMNAKGSTCPFKAKKEGGCCHSSTEETKLAKAEASGTETEADDDQEWTHERIQSLLSKYGNLEEYSEDQLKACPHYESLIKPLLKQKPSEGRAKNGSKLKK